MPHIMELFSVMQGNTMAKRLTPEQKKARAQAKAMRAPIEHQYYALIEDGHAYIGVTTRGVKRRFQEHMSSARNCDGKVPWLQEIVADGRAPTCIVLEALTHRRKNTDWIERAWMFVAARQGFTVVNFAPYGHAMPEILKSPRPYMSALMSGRQWPQLDIRSAIGSDRIEQER